MGHTLILHTLTAADPCIDGVVPSELARVAIPAITGREPCSAGRARNACGRASLELKVLQHINVARQQGNIGAEHTPAAP